MPTALITGAARGLGRAVAKHLSQKGYDLLVTSRSQAGLQSLANECPTKVQTCPVDLADMNKGVSTLCQAADKLPRLDLLFFSHGIHIRGLVSELPEADVNLMLQLHLLSTISITHRLLPKVQASATNDPDKQAIIFMGSVSSKLAMKKNSIYAAAKHGLFGFANALYEEVREDGIKVSTICPGYIDSRAHTHAKLDPSKMIQIADIVETVDFIMNASSTVCPTNIDLRPQRTPNL